MGKQRALGTPMCGQRLQNAREYSVLSTYFNTCLPYFKEESKITRDFAAQCSMFTYTHRTSL